jgi:hypothetical protein
VLIDAPDEDHWLYHFRANATLLTAIAGTVRWRAPGFRETGLEPHGNRARPASVTLSEKHPGQSVSRLRGPDQRVGQRRSRRKPPPAAGR